MTKFVVSGQPVSVNDAGTPRYATWKAKVTAEAMAGKNVYIGSGQEGRATVTYLHHVGRQVDVDNILKPILDGMITVVYADDNVVQQVTSRRIPVAFHTKLAANDPITVKLLAAALQAMALNGENAVIVSVSPFSHAASLSLD